jgi:hypothetical protein
MHSNQKVSSIRFFKILNIKYFYELLERLVSSFSPTFKDTNKKTSIYAILRIRVS